MDSTNQTPRPELMIVMPVYNEQASVCKVVMEWFSELDNWTENFVFLAINDGSKDGTLHILERLRTKLGPRLEIIDRENLGHGQSCIQGYKTAIERGVPYVLQIDSDGQCDPQFFFRFWRMREQYDVIYGRRKKRDDGLRRVVASMVLKTVLLLSCGALCVDANVPYRLMRLSSCGAAIGRIPRDFFLANVALAVLLRKTVGIRHGVVNIRFRERYGGEPSVPFSKFAVRARELVGQCRALLKSS